MSPPVHPEGLPVKKLNRRELSCVPFLLFPFLLFRPLFALLLRGSNTEPIVRLIAETPSEDQSKALIARAKQIIVAV